MAKKEVKRAYSPNTRGIEPASWPTQNNPQEPNGKPNGRPNGASYNYTTHPSTAHRTGLMSLHRYIYLGTQVVSTLAKAWTSGTYLCPGGSSSQLPCDIRPFT